MKSISTKESSALAGLAGKYLTFVLGGESYGIPILCVREIVKIPTITAMPKLPPDVRGVINLRGKIIPVVNLHIRLGMSSGGDKDSTCIIVVQVRTSKGSIRSMGLIVDAVEEVSQIGANDIEETPDFGIGIDTSFILGVAKIRGVVKALLDISKVLGGDIIDEQVIGSIQ